MSAASLRRGACPTLPEPMATGDGLLARLALATPLILPQLAGLADLADAHGNGVVEVTARGKLQVRGLTVLSAPDFAAGIGALGIEVREGLGIETNPLAGLDPDAAFDPRPLVEEIAARAMGLSARLAPKIAVLVDGGGALHLDAQTADIRLNAHEDGRLLLSAGGIALGLVAPEKAAEAVLALLESLAARGKSARMSEWLQTDGVASVSAVLHGISLIPAAFASRIRPAAEPIGLHPLSGGACALGVGLAFGQTDGAALRELARLAGQAGACRISTAGGRAILVIGVTRAAAEALCSDLAALGFITQADDPRRLVSACQGRPACASARLETRALALALAPLARGRSVHVSGCAKGCAHPSAAAFTIVGLDEGAGIVVEGTPRDVPVQTVPVARLAAAARAMLETKIG